jgi:hypothetical protein
VMAGMLGMALLGVAMVARAGTAELTWEAPTENCDKTPLTDLTGYSLLYGQLRSERPPSPTAYTVTGLAPGKWWFSLAAVTADGTRSEFVTAEKEILPEDFKTINSTVYTFIKAEDRIIVLPVGTVALGTQCDFGLSVNGKYVVPRSAVIWSGSTRPVVVVADCG